MSNSRTHPCVLALAALLLSLLTPLAAQQKPDRAAPPRPGPPPAVNLPEIQKRTLSNGLAVWIVELHEVPVVEVDLIVRSGSSADPAQRHGLASLTADMLDEGAGSRDALAIADAVDYLGASLSTSTSFDASAVRLYVPVARLSGALAIMADVALRPSFPAKELERLRQERLTDLIQVADDPASLVRVAFPRLVYGAAHRYGTSAVGTAASIRAITLAELKEFHARSYQPSNAALLVAGDVKADAAVALLERTFGGWKAGTKAAAPAVPPPSQLETRRVYIVDKPGAAQSQIRIGWVGVPRSTPDYFSIMVMNTILGGSFTSRLNQNLREEHGYAYGAGSGFDMRAGPGPFFAAAGVQTDKTAEALREFFNELNGIREPVPAEELQKAKNNIALGFPSELETTSQIAGHLAQMFVYGLPADYFSTYVPRVQAVTAGDVHRVAQKYIQPDKFAVVVVGDRKAIEAGIKSLDLGPIDVVSVEDVMK
jgi:predicted Zn-dependent peptidase